MVVKTGRTASSRFLRRAGDFDRSICAWVITADSGQRTVNSTAVLEIINQDTARDGSEKVRFNPSVSWKR